MAMPALMATLKDPLMDGLAEKGVPFEYVLTIPEQSEAVLTRSPRGKVPFLETPEGFINESSAILDYLEERGEGTPLLPSAPFARAQVRALMREIELYVELPARSCYGEAFFGGTVPEGRPALKASGQQGLQDGVQHWPAPRGRGDPVAGVREKPVGQQVCEAALLRH